MRSSAMPDRRDHLPLGEDAHETPEADTTAVFVSRLHIKIARALECSRHEKVGQASFRDFVAVQHAALAPLLVVDDEIEGEACCNRFLREGVRPHEGLAFPIAAHPAWALK